MSAGLDRGPAVGDSHLNLRIQFGQKKSPGQEVSRKKPETFFLRRKGGFWIQLPPIFSTIFQPSEKGGEQSVRQQKHETVTQTGTNRHKPAQTGTNRHNRKPAIFLWLHKFWGGKLTCPLFIVVTPSAASMHPRGWVPQLVCRMATWGAGGVWQREDTEGQMWPPPRCWHHICPRCRCGLILLPLPRLLLATAPPPLTTSHHRYRLVDCPIVSAADATLLASYL
jgi:hypothetical protein